MKIQRREFLKTAAITTGSIYLQPSIQANASQSETTQKPSDWLQRLSIMDTWFFKTKLDAQGKADMLNRLGVPRICVSLGNAFERFETFHETLKTFDDSGIELIATYMAESIDEDAIPAHVIQATPIFARHSRRIKIERIAVIFQRTGPIYRLFRY